MAKVPPLDFFCEVWNAVARRKTFPSSRFSMKPVSSLRPSKGGGGFSSGSTRALSGGCALLLAWLSKTENEVNRIFRQGGIADGHAGGIDENLDARVTEGAQLPLLGHAGQFVPAEFFSKESRFHASEARATSLAVCRGR